MNSESAIHYVRGTVSRRYREFLCSPTNKFRPSQVKASANSDTSFAVSWHTIALECCRKPSNLTA